MSGRPMRVQASTARESRRHLRGIRRRPTGGERNEARRGADNERPTILIPNQGLRGGRILSRMPHHAESRRGNAEIRPTPLRADRGFEIQRRKDEHHAGSSGSKAPVQGRCFTDRGGDGINAYHPVSGGGRGPHVGCDHDPP